MFYLSSRAEVFESWILKWLGASKFAARIIVVTQVKFKVELVGVRPTAVVSLATKMVVGPAVSSIVHIHYTRSIDTSS